MVMPKKLIIEKSLRLGFSTTNNEAEYKALLVGIAMVKLLDTSSLTGASLIGVCNLHMGPS